MLQRALHVAYTLQALLHSSLYPPTRSPPPPSESLPPATSSRLTRCHLQTSRTPSPPRRSKSRGAPTPPAAQKHKHIRDGKEARTRRGREREGTGKATPRRRDGAGGEAHVTSTTTRVCLAGWRPPKPRKSRETQPEAEETNHLKGGEGGGRDAPTS